MRFEGQVAVVTGASRGIGREIALAFAKEGAAVACVATSLEGAEAVAMEIEKNAGRGCGFACDISDSGQVNELFERVSAAVGPPGVLVNNAGITKDTLILRMKDEDWARVLEVNLTGAFNCIRAASRLMMKERYGRILNMSSVIGLGGGAGQANYAAAKAGLIGLTKSVAKEFGSRGITCNALAPGFIETDMTVGLSMEFREFVEKNAPAGRLGTPSDVAPAALFLCSRDAGYITGQVLTVDGGLTL